jgi:hypothetical protein
MEWIVDTPQGQTKINIAKRNDFGILDQFVTLPSGIEIFVPMRVVKNDDGSEIMLTVFQTLDMSEKKYIEDTRLVEKDLENLKNLLEAEQIS